MLRSRGDGKAARCRQQTMIDLNSLAIFAKVAETRSFSEAARRLKLPISTVSRRVAELEDQLGVGLLERSTRNLRLTDIGAEIFEQAQRSGEISEAVGSIVSNQSSTVSGVLRLSATQHFRYAAGTTGHRFSGLLFRCARANSGNGPFRRPYRRGGGSGLPSGGARGLVAYCPEATDISPPIGGQPCLCRTRQISREAAGPS